MKKPVFMQTYVVMRVDLITRRLDAIPKAKLGALVCRQRGFVHPCVPHDCIFPTLFAVAIKHICFLLALPLSSPPSSPSSSSASSPAALGDATVIVSTQSLGTSTATAFDSTPITNTAFEYPYGQHHIITTVLTTTTAAIIIAITTAIALIQLLPL